MSSPRFNVVLARSSQEIEPHLSAWWDLHDVRLEDNVYSSPAFLSELYRHCRGDTTVAFVYRLSAGIRTLLAVVPFGDPRRQGAMTVLPSCGSNLVYSSTPLLHGELAREAVAAIWEWAARGPWSMVQWESMELDSLAWKLLRRQLEEAGRRWWPRYEY